jgi:hypothetical protein
MARARESHATAAPRRWPWRGSLLAGALASACSGKDTVLLLPGEGAAGAAPAAEPGAAQCGNSSEGSIGKSRAALSVVDRSLVGAPAAYHPDETLAARTLELIASQRARRQVAWQIAERVLTPAPLPVQLPAGVPASLPAWQTWHAKDDITRIFRRAYPELTPSERSLRAPFPRSALDAAWSWNDGAISDFPEWTAERLATYQDAIGDASELSGLAGIYRVAYAPAASRQLIDSYAEVLRCRERAVPAAPEAAASPVGPAGDARCGLPPSPPPDCLASAFPASASIIKASWRRSEIDSALPVYDTSADGLARRLAPDGKFSWAEPDGAADPGPDEIYTLRLPNGNAFRLAALHIMTKELDHWYWLTLWWSPEPDSDFGADRPATLPAPFQHYKLCSVVAFNEADPDPRGGFDDLPSLGDSLETAYAGLGGPSWCSNPYLEDGDGNAGSNCIGCHQHAGTGLRTETILANPSAFPDHTRQLVRADFPSDYVFGASVGDDLGAMFQETEQHYAE